MALPNSQKISLAFGVILMWGDQISDVVMGVLYYMSCHVKWAMASFFFSSLPNILTFCGFLFESIVIFRNGEIIGGIGTILCGLVLTIFMPIFVCYSAFKQIAGTSDDISDIDLIKSTKSLEAVFEAIPQLILNIYIRAYLAPFDDGSDIIFLLQVISISISYFAFVYCLGETFVRTHSGAYFPNIGDVYVIRAIFVILPDITLKILLILISLLTFGTKYVFVLFAVLIVFHIVVSKKDSEVKFKPFHILDLFSLIATNLPYGFDDQDTFVHKSLHKIIQFNKSVSYFTFFIVLSAITSVLVLHETGQPTIFTEHIRKGQNLTMDEEMMDKYIYFNCEELCHAHDAFIKIEMSREESFQGSINYNIATNISSVNRSRLIEDLTCLDFHETLWIDEFVSNYQNDSSTVNLQKKETFCKTMALNTDFLLILTGVAWFFLIVCIVDFKCELLGYGLLGQLKLIEELETNPDYGPKNKELAKIREVSIGAKKKAKRKAKVNNDASNSQNTSEDN